MKPTANELKNNLSLYLYKLNKLEIELSAKGKDYLINQIPPENIQTEEDLYNYPIDDYEELFNLIISGNMNNISKIFNIIFWLDESGLRDYIDTRF